MEAEFFFLVHHFQAVGYESCYAAFGGAWAMDYDAVERGDGPVRFEALPHEVLQATTADWGGLGLNDLFLSIPPLPLQFRFCNDSDIHLVFGSPCDQADFFRIRWETLGYQPAESKGANPQFWVWGSQSH